MALWQARRADIRPREGRDRDRLRSRAVRFVAHVPWRWPSRHPLCAPTGIKLITEGGGDGVSGDFARCRCLRGVTTGVRAACASRPKTDATRETRPPRAPAPNPTKNRMVYKVSTRVCVRVSRDLRRRAPTAYTCCTCDRVAPPRLPATMYSPVPVLRTGSRRRELDRREVESAERFARTLLPSQFSPAVLLTTT